MREHSPASSSGTSWLKLLAPVLASIAGLITLRLAGPDIVTQATLSAWLRPLGELAPIVFIAFLAVRPVTLLPGQLFTAVGGLLFGTVAGTAYAMIGSALACAVTFMLGRKLGRPAMERFAGARYEPLQRFAHQNGFQFSALACVSPLVPTDVAVAAAGASGARFIPTAAGMLLATLPGTWLTAQFGSALGQGKTIMTALSAAGMVLSIALGVLFGRKLWRALGTTPPASRRRDDGLLLSAATSQSLPPRSPSTPRPLAAR